MVHSVSLHVSRPCFKQLLTKGIFWPGSRAERDKHFQLSPLYYWLLQVSCSAWIMKLNISNFLQPRTIAVNFFCIGRDKWKLASSDTSMTHTNGEIWCLLDHGKSTKTLHHTTQNWNLYEDARVLEKLYCPSWWTLPFLAQLPSFNPKKEETQHDSVLKSE